MLHRFLKDERGATAIEYGLIAALMFLAVVAVISQVADSNTEMYQNISDTVVEATGTG